MQIEIQLTQEPIPGKIYPPAVAQASRPFEQKLAGETPAPLRSDSHGAWLEFHGVVRGEENGQSISALEYEAYPEMAEHQMRQILESLATRFSCLATKVIHRVGIIPVGETAIYAGIASAHRGEAIALLTEFMNRLKLDVPIWKRRALPASERGSVSCSTSRESRANQAAASHRPTLRSLDEALAEIRFHCQSLPAVHAPLEDCFGRVLRETVSAPADSPDCDRSTRDGYAILQDDKSDSFTVVDTLHAADWKPRQLKIGEAIRIATGATLPCKDLRVVMQENVERNGDRINIKKRESALNIRKQGEEMKAGQPLLLPGARLDAGKLALLASVGCVRPAVSPRLRVIHFTTGDEIIPPAQTPKPGQIRNSNSTLIRGLLQRFPCDVTQHHLPENFEAAKQLISTFGFQPSDFDLLLVSGGASVGDKDFTRPLLEWLGFEVVFSQVNVRPGRPLIFGVAGEANVPASRLISSLAPPNKVRVAFGLPGNPLSHFVCFHLFVATALSKLIGEEPKGFLRGRLAAKLDDTLNPRETLWPAFVGQAFEPASFGNRGQECPVNQQTEMSALQPLAWASSGDLTCLTKTNALIRVPANQGSIGAGLETDFWPTDF